MKAEIACVMRLVVRGGSLAEKRIFGEDRLGSAEKKTGEAMEGSWRLFQTNWRGFEGTYEGELDPVA
ncbi:hypothetical protein BH09VER1_BH09VER1_06460 [soil metagenome]